MVKKQPVVSIVAAIALSVLALLCGSLLMPSSTVANMGDATTSIAAVTRSNTEQLAIANDPITYTDFAYLPFVARNWPPIPPALHDITNDDFDGYYAVGWTESLSATADAYFLEEAVYTFPYWCFFNTSVYTGTATSWSVPAPGKEPGTYLYRVRGRYGGGSYSDYSNIEGVTVAPTPTAAFIQVIEQLDTPQKLSNFLLNEFQWTYHDGCVSYWPEEFYNRKEGDCKDYATLTSYVLAKHEYYTEIITFTFYDQEGTRYGHVVVIYQDKDGSFKYISNGEIVATVTSVSDVLEKEKQRTNASRIGGYLVLPPGTIIVCSPDEMYPGICPLW